MTEVQVHSPWLAKRLGPKWEKEIESSLGRENVVSQTEHGPVSRWLSAVPSQTTEQLHELGHGDRSGKKQ
jgi:hypothetical protein